MTTTASSTGTAKALSTLDLQSKLAGTPNGSPDYPVTVGNAAGDDVVLGDPRATRAALALMNMEAVAGGAAAHWGGPAALAEAMSAVHGIMFAEKDRPWHQAYNFSNDAGHTENGVYALRANYGFDGMTVADLKGFRSISSKLTGHGESHLNPEGVLLSNGPLGSSLPQAQGLAMADRAAGRDRVTIVTLSDGAAMEGEAKEAFSAIPGLAAKGLVAPFVLIISDNDTKLSGRITQDSFSMAPSLAAMDDLGWNVIEVENGNDLQAVYLAVEKAIQTARADAANPVCIRLHTVKGYGVKATEESSSGGHAFPLKTAETMIDFISEIYGGTPPEEFLKWAKELKAAHEKKAAAKKPAPADGPKKEKIQAGLARAAIRAVKDGYPVYSISADLAGSTGIKPFQQEYPERAIDIGVAEANMVSVGAGFAKAGFIPLVDTFAQFGVTKGNLPLTMAALSQAPVIALFSHCGFQDAADGASHQATAYFAAVCAIPHTEVVACSCSAEAEALLYEAIRRHAENGRAGRDGESVIFFVGRENYPAYLDPDAKYEWGKAQVLAEGSDVTIAACGPLVGAALEAGKMLSDQGISATVINNPFINRVDTGTIGPAVKKTGGRLVTLEDHQVTCGMGAQLVHALAREGTQVTTAALGINGAFGQSAYMAQHLYDKHGMTAAKVAEAARKLIGK